MIKGQVVEWTGSGSVELPIAGGWQAATRTAHQGYCRVLSVSGLCWLPMGCLLTPRHSASLTQVAGRLHVEVMRVTGAVPERVVEDDSSENSSESGSLEVVDSSGEIIHRVKKLTCRVRGHDGEAQRNYLFNSKPFYRKSYEFFIKHSKS